MRTKKVQFSELLAYMNQTCLQYYNFGTVKNADGTKYGEFYTLSNKVVNAEQIKRVFNGRVIVRVIGKQYAPEQRNYILIILSQKEVNKLKN